MKILRLISGMTAIVVAVALSGAYSPPARAQAFNPELWGNDNCLYTWRNGAWAPSGLCRTFPNPDNPKVWDLVNAQRTPLYRFAGVDASGV
jgi:hypothetical protein